MRRSPDTELLDRDDIPFEDVKQNMQELNFINSRLGGHAVTVAGIKKIVTRFAKAGHPIHVCEIGCGGGDNLSAINNWGVRNNIPFHLTGIDIKQECIAYAKERISLGNFSWIISDYTSADFAGQQPDIIFSSLFCHHFKGEQLTGMMRWMQHNSRMGFFINDLHRNRLAYHAITLLTKWFSKSYLVKHDAPLSVRRGFVRKDWQRIMQQSGISQYSIEWKWAFRWLVTVTA